MHKNNLNAALTYAKRGWRVLPVYSVKGGRCTCPKGKGCSRPGKHPITKHGVKDATSNLKLIKGWWKKNSDANVGIAAGKDTGVMVLDVDSRNGGLDTFAAAKLQYGKLPVSPKSLTPGKGFHLLFQVPKTAIRLGAGKALGVGVDVLTNGSYFVAPGSVGVGGRYRWAPDKSPDQVKLPKLPKPWASALSATLAAKAPSAVPNSSIPEGSRNTVLTSMAGSMRRSGISEDAILAALLAENQHCKPPLNAAEVEGIVRSVCRHYSTEGGTEDTALQLVHGVLANNFADGRHLLAEQGYFWHYEGTHWVRVDDHWIKATILTAIEQLRIKSRSTTASLLDQCLRIMQARLAAKAPRLAGLSEGAPVINTLTGELWLKEDGTVEVRAHRPESYLTHCLKIKYDPAATSPIYDKAVAKIFSKAKEPGDMVRHWHELFGYAIQPSRNLATIVLSFGKGGNGKTKLWNTVIKLLGEDLVAAQDINTFEAHRFSMANLFGKLLLLDDDVQSGTKLPDGFLKTVSEMKVVTAEDKYKPPFNFRARALPVLLCNSPPSCADLSHGMQRRLMVIPFKRKFKKDDDKTLFNRIWKRELPGILNHALAGFVRLSKRGDWDLPADVKTANRMFLLDSNPVPAFIAECCVADISSSVYLKDFYLQFQQWCVEAGITMKQQRKTVKSNLSNLSYKFGRGSKGPKIMGLRIT